MVCRPQKKPASVDLEYSKDYQLKLDETKVSQIPEDFLKILIVRAVSLTMDSSMTDVIG